MREIVLDTETTGLDPSDGHRIVEIGCVELFDQLPTGNTFQRYINPDRLVAGSDSIHGITDEFLTDKPRFAEIVDDFLTFIGDAPLVAHNAGFDMKFLNHELRRLDRAIIPFARAVDTIEIAKVKLPGMRYSLDELCKYYSVDLSSRTRHGALLDAHLLAQVYLELTGGRQTKLVLAPIDGDTVVVLDEVRVARVRPVPLAPRISETERASHAAFIAELGDDALWTWAA
jgi:DNA polymerase-3 subunit epsilon